jgi:hypothetical protein
MHALPPPRSAVGVPIVALALGVVALFLLPAPSLGATVPVGQLPPPLAPGIPGTAIVPNGPPPVAPWGGSVLPNAGLNPPSYTPVPPVHTSIFVNTSLVMDPIDSEFWGGNVNLGKLPNATATQDLASAGLGYVLWPSGKANDEYNFSSGKLTAENGSVSTPQGNLSQFVAWCKLAQCTAIIGLPAEINDSAQAAAEVNYLENTLNFHPAYYELGNEPALWTHFGLRWSGWAANQTRGITPLQYAILVKEYIHAITAVDADARIIGLPGTGQGGFQEAAWVYDVLAVNGHSIDAIGMHVYPAGHLTAASGTLTQFDQSLTGKGGLDWRVPLVRAAITQACPTCHTPIFVTEYNAATVGPLGNVGSYAQYMQGFDDVPYVAAEVAQGLEQRVRNMDLYNFQSGFAGSLLTPNATTKPLFYLFSDLFSQLQATAVNTTFSTLPGGFTGVATLGASGNRTVLSVLLVNPNPSGGVDVNFTSLHLPRNTSTTIGWFDAALNVPSSLHWRSWSPTNWAILAESVAVVQFVY